jgi:hypothetical protein
VLPTWLGGTRDATLDIGAMLVASSDSVVATGRVVHRIDYG